MAEDKPKVVSLQLRRKQQLSDRERLSDSTVSKIADELTSLLGEQQKREVKSSDPSDAFAFAVDQLLGVEFATNALLAVLMRALGPTVVNSVMVEVDRRRHFYKVEWPEHAQDKTYFDHLPKKEERPPAEVIPLVPTDEDAVFEEEWRQFCESFRGKLMQPTISEGNWYIVFHGEDDASAYPKELFLAEVLKREHPDMVGVEEVYGFGAYLSAPGFLDKTDTVVFDTEKEAKEYLMTTYGDDG